VNGISVRPGRLAHGGFALAGLWAAILTFRRGGPDELVRLRVRRRLGSDRALPPHRVTGAGSTDGPNGGPDAPGRRSCSRSAACMRSSMRSSASIRAATSCSPPTGERLHARSAVVRRLRWRGLASPGHRSRSFALTPFARLARLSYAHQGPVAVGTWRCRLVSGSGYRHAGRWTPCARRHGRRPSAAATSSI